MNGELFIKNRISDENRNEFRETLKLHFIQILGMRSVCLREVGFW